MLFLQPQRFFEREGIRLIDFEAEIVLLNPAAARVDAKLRVARRDLLDGDQDFHGKSAPSRSVYRLKIRQPLVPPNPNEFDSA
jgi:hypothetical protein